MPVLLSSMSLLYTNNMNAIPAIDLIDGRCVRLTEGSFDSITVYNDDPASMARNFAIAGARRLHLVDLDAARGRGNNRDTIAQIRRSFSGTLDVGGGIRTEEDARQLLDIGVDLLVLGTALVKKPEAVRQWVERLGAVFSAGIDARNSEVKVSGWEEGSSIRARDLAKKAKEIGAVEIIYTDIARDGTLKGPNIAETLALARSCGLPVVISGGVGSMDDLRNIADRQPAELTGVIIGKALYEGKIDLKEALEIMGAGI